MPLTRGIRKTSAATSLNPGKDLAGDVGVSIHAWFPFVSSPAPLADSRHLALCSGYPTETRLVTFCYDGGCFQLNWLGPLRVVLSWVMAPCDGLNGHMGHTTVGDQRNVVGSGEHPRTSPRAWNEAGGTHSYWSLGVSQHM